MNRLWGLIAAGVALAAAAAALPAAAQNYPSKAIRLVSPFPPGGSVDVVGRLLAAKLSESMGQQMVVDNRSGASGVIGTEIVMNSPPDGYTLLINTIPFVSNQFLMPRAPYDPLRDFVSISLVASSPSFVTVHPSLPVRSIQVSLDGDTQEVYGRQRPGGSLASAHAACRAVRAAGLPLEITFAPTRIISSLHLNSGNAMPMTNGT